METRKILIVGDSLFGETLAQMLANTRVVHVLGPVPTIAAATCLLASQQPDALIVAGINIPLASLEHLLAAHPDLSLIRADLNANKIQVISSRQIGACPSDLLAAIAELPKRRNA